MPVVKALKNFRGEPGEGDANNFVLRGSEVTLTDERHRALARNGLVESPEDPKAKKAPDPQNKMRDDPPNKNITHATMQTKRAALDDPNAAQRLNPQAPKLDLNDPNAAKKIVENSNGPLAGGATGAGNAPSSSHQARQPRRRTSRLPGAAPKS